MFRDLKAANEEDEVRKDVVHVNAKDAVGCGQMIGARWRPQYLDRSSNNSKLSQSPHSHTVSECPLGASHARILPVRNDKVHFNQSRSSKELAKDDKKTCTS